MSKIEKLTAEQEAMIPVYRDKWIKIGTSCDPCNLEESKKYAKMAYNAAGLKCPDKFYLVDSPMAAAKLEVELSDQKFSRKEDYNDALYKAINSQIFGYHEAGWLSYYEFMWKELGITDCAKLEGLIGIAKNCGWWAPYTDCVILQHRHEELHVDDQFRLHNESGPAVRYRDGYSVWAINGIRVNEQIVMRPETLTVEQINNEANQDIRSIMIDRFGWPKYLEKSNAKCVDFRDNNIEGTKEALYISPIGGRRLVVTCPTGRVFALGVPEETGTCEQAQFWLSGNRKVNVIGRT
jgi:hypothetical protein